VDAFESLKLGAEPASKAEVAQQRKENKRLDREILRKDKALAEAAALLVLSKKAQAIWGSKEED
jgi:transposase